MNGEKNTALKDASGEFLSEGELLLLLDRKTQQAATARRMGAIFQIIKAEPGPWPEAIARSAAGNMQVTPPTKGVDYAGKEGLEEFLQIGVLSYPKILERLGTDTDLQKAVEHGLEIYPELQEEWTQWSQEKSRGPSPSGPAPR